MSIYSVDWSTLFSSSSILPPDISFRIISEDGKEEVLEAHRTVLCLLSPVFRAYLSEGGSWHNAGSQIIIKDVAWKPFQTMLDFLYKKEFNISEHFNNIEELFEILEVADRYQVETLVNVCKKFLLNFPMELNSVVQIVNTAKYYRNLEPFAIISEEIIEQAMDSLSSKLNTAADVLFFLARPDTDNSTLEDSIKLELLKNLATRKYEECVLNKGSMCVLNKGNNVTHENMAVGSWVEVRSKSLFRYDSLKELEVGEQGKITKIADTEYTIAWDKQAYDLTYQVSRDFHVPMKFICKCQIKNETLKHMEGRKCDVCDANFFSNGKDVTNENMVEGAWVEVKERSLFKYDALEMLEVGEQGNITEVTDTEYTIVWNKESYNALTYEKSRDFHVPIKFICKCDQ